MARFQALSDVLGRIWTAIEQLDGIVKAIDGEVDGKVAELYGLIRTEAEHLGNTRSRWRNKTKTAGPSDWRWAEALPTGQKRMDDFVLTPRWA